MPKLSITLIKEEYRTFKEEEVHKPFGPYMNDKFSLADYKLHAELDNNIALLRLLKDHVQEEL